MITFATCLSTSYCANLLVCLFTNDKKLISTWISTSILIKLLLFFIAVTSWSFSFITLVTLSYILMPTLTSLSSSLTEVEPIVISSNIGIIA